MVADDARVQFEFKGFGPDEREAAEALAAQVNEQGGQAQVRSEGGPGHELAFIPIIIGAIAVMALVNVIKNFIDDNRKGVVVDARGDKVVTTVDEDLPSGTVVLIGKDGTITLEQPDHETLGDAMKAALDALGLGGKKDAAGAEKG